MAAILFIEDDLVDQMAIERLFQQQPENIQITMADCLDKAKSILKSEQYDLVFSDLHLGDGSARELLHKKEHYPPLIIITGLNDQSIFDELTELGACRILVKDNDLEYLQQISSIINEFTSGQDNTSASICNDVPSSTLANQPGRHFNISGLLSNPATDDPFAFDMVQAFLTENPKQLRQLEDAIRRQSTADIKSVAHRIKSGYRLMGMQTAYDTADQLEKNPQSPPQEHARLLSILQEKSMTVYPEMRKLLGLD